MITPEAGDASRFEYRGWIVQIEVASSSNSGDSFAGHADLFHDGTYKCRVVLATSRADSTSARWALDSKARDFIDEWTMRPRSGDTGFQDL